MASSDALELIIRAKDEASEKLSGVGKAIGGLATLAAGAGVALIGMGAAIAKLAVDAAPLEGIKNAFAGISGSADETLAKLREMSGNMVRDTDLMKSYNLAAMLVSKTFADQLPGAMGMLQKAAAATGTDMNYMMDSLVRGVGRLSPLILDNLGIQASLAEATARAAEMFGVEESALSKAQTQAGMMAVVMEKLKATTATMPEVTGTAAATMAQLQTTIANLKDVMGMAFLPVLNAVLTPLAKLATDNGPAVIAWSQQFATFLTGTVVPAVTAFFTTSDTTFNNVRAVIETTLTAAQAIITTIVGGISAYWQENHTQFETTARTVWGVILGVWSTTVSSISSIVQSVIGQLVTWWAANHETIKTTVSTALVAIQTFWATHGAAIQTIAQTIWTTIGSIITLAINAILNTVTAVMLLLQGNWSGAWGAIQAGFGPIWEALKVAALTGINAVSQIVRDVLESIRVFIIGLVGAWSAAGAALLQGMVDGIKSKVGSLIDAARGAVSNALQAARNLLGMHSPSQAFREIGENMMAGWVLGLVGSQEDVIRQIGRIAEQAAAEAPKLKVGASAALEMRGVSQNSGYWFTVGRSLGNSFAQGVSAGMGAVQTTIPVAVSYY